MKICPVGRSFSMRTYRHTDSQTDTTKLVVAFRNVANAPVISPVSNDWAPAVAGSSESARGLRNSKFCLVTGEPGRCFYISLVYWNIEVIMRPMHNLYRPYTRLDIIYNWCTENIIVG
jgi:hypothetical protein